MFHSFITGFFYCPHESFLNFYWKVSFPEKIDDTDREDLHDVRIALKEWRLWLEGGRTPPGDLN